MIVPNRVNKAGGVDGGVADGVTGGMAGGVAVVTFLYVDESVTTRHKWYYSPRPTGK